MNENDDEPDDDNDERDDNAEEEEDDDDDDVEEEAKEKYKNPLNLIDLEANLDAVLNTRSIGDAIQLLCPNMPGLPTKPRGKYNKRRLLTKEEKTKMMKDQNRENARRTRKRKKLYDLFLTNLIKDLENVLDSEVDQNLDSNLNMDGNTNPKKRKGDSNEPISSDQTTIQKKSNSIEKNQIFESRIETLRYYLSMRISAGISKEYWLRVCSPDIVNYMPIPSYRKVNYLSGVKEDGHYECKGIDALIEDSENRVHFVNSIITSRGSIGRFTWKSDIDIHIESSIFGNDGHSLCCYYDHFIYEVPVLSNEQLAPKTFWTQILKIAVSTNVKFDRDGRIIFVNDQFDVIEIVRQSRVITHLKQQLDIDKNKFMKNPINVSYSTSNFKDELHRTSLSPMLPLPSIYMQQSKLPQFCLTDKSNNNESVDNNNCNDHKYSNNNNKLSWLTKISPNAFNNSKCNNNNNNNNNNNFITQNTNNNFYNFNHSIPPSSSSSSSSSQYMDSSDSNNLIYHQHYPTIQQRPCTKPPSSISSDTTTAPPPLDSLLLQLYNKIGLPSPCANSSLTNQQIMNREDNNQNNYHQHQQQLDNQNNYYYNTNNKNHDTINLDIQSHPLFPSYSLRDTTPNYTSLASSLDGISVVDTLASYGIISNNNNNSTINNYPISTTDNKLNMLWDNNHRAADSILQSPSQLQSQQLLPRSSQLEMLQKLILSPNQLIPAANYELSLPEYQRTATGNQQQSVVQQQQQQQQHGSSSSFKSQKISTSISTSSTSNTLYPPLCPQQEIGSTRKQAGGGTLPLAGVVLGAKTIDTDIPSSIPPSNIKFENQPQEQTVWPNGLQSSSCFLPSSSTYFLNTGYTPLVKNSNSSNSNSSTSDNNNDDVNNHKCLPSRIINTHHLQQQQQQQQQQQEFPSPSSIHYPSSLPPPTQLLEENHQSFYLTTRPPPMQLSMAVSSLTPSTVNDSQVMHTY